MVQYRKGRKSPYMVQARNERGAVITTSFQTREAAEKYEAAFRDRKKLIKRGVRAPALEILFVDYAPKWLRTRHSKGDVTHSSFAQDESKLRRVWVPLLGAFPLTAISTGVILEELDRLQSEEGIAPATRNRHRALLHTLFEDAFREERIDMNPVARIALVEEKQVRKKTVIRDMAQIDKYVAALRAESPEYGILGEILIGSGCRISEAIGLQYGDVDARLGVITFRRIEERAGGSKIVDRVKDDEDNTVPLFPRLRQAIAGHRARAYYSKDTSFVASRSDGSYVRYDAFKEAHKRALAAAKLPASVTPHTLRASFATLAKMAGYTRAEVGEMLGHSSELVTKRYDLKDIQHLVDKGKRVGFGAVQRVRRVK